MSNKQPVLLAYLSTLGPRCSVLAEFYTELEKDGQLFRDLAQKGIYGSEGITLWGVLKEVKFNN